MGYKGWDRESYLPSPRTAHFLPVFILLRQWFVSNRGTESIRDQNACRCPFFTPKPRTKRMQTKKDKTIFTHQHVVKLISKHPEPAIDRLLRSKENFTITRDRSAPQMFRPDLGPTRSVNLSSEA